MRKINHLKKYRVFPVRYECQLMSFWFADCAAVKSGSEIRVIKRSYVARQQTQSRSRHDKNNDA